MNYSSAVYDSVDFVSGTGVGDAVGFGTDVNVVVVAGNGFA